MKSLHINLFIANMCYNILFLLILNGNKNQVYWASKLENVLSVLTKNYLSSIYFSILFYIKLNLK